MPDAQTKLRVTIHAPEPDALLRAQSNARNLLAVAPDAEIEIVANAAGVSAFLDAPEADPAIAPLVRLCANTLQRMGREAPQNVRTVPAAIEHLVLRQTQGWAYVRA